MVRASLKAILCLLDERDSACSEVPTATFRSRIAHARPGRWHKHERSHEEAVKKLEALAQCTLSRAQRKKVEERRRRLGVA